MRDFKERYIKELKKGGYCEWDINYFCKPKALWIAENLNTYQTNMLNFWNKEHGQRILLKNSYEDLKTIKIIRDKADGYFALGCGSLLLGFMGYW